MVSEYVTSLVRTTAVLNDRGLTYTLLNKYSSFVPSARELTATDTYIQNWETNEIGSGRFTYDVVVWIDSDIEWEPDDLLRLYESDKKIISGLYQTSPVGWVAVNRYDETGRPVKVNKVEYLLHDEPTVAGGVGFGFVAMKQGVFETMKRPWFKIRFVRWDGHDFDTNVGEDYSWCMNAQDAGFEVWVDPLVKVKHHKGVVYEV